MVVSTIFLCSILAVLEVIPDGNVVDVAVIDVSVVDFCCCFIACNICCADAVLDVVRFGTGGLSSSSSSSWSAKVVDGPT